MAVTLFKNLTIPKNCMECEWRDAEACGECELMIRNPFLSFEEQYAHCPFGVIAKRHPLVTVPPHGRLIDADALEKDIDEYIGGEETRSRFHHWVQVQRTVIPESKEART